jgi:hypothetical protein
MSRKVSFFLVFALPIISSGLFVQAQNTPNVTGTWKMNAEKSKFERGGPTAITIKFEQQGSTLNEAITVTNDGGERTGRFTYTLDGKEGLNRMEGQQIKTKARWEGESLIIEFENNEGSTFLRRITLSGDGKAMTINVKHTDPNRAASDIIVFERL